MLLGELHGGTKHCICRAVGSGFSFVMGDVSNHIFSLQKKSITFQNCGCDAEVSSASLEMYSCPFVIVLKTFSPSERGERLGNELESVKLVFIVSVSVLLPSDVAMASVSFLLPVVLLVLFSCGRSDVSLAESSSCDCVTVGVLVVFNLFLFLSCLMLVAVAFSAISRSFFLRAFVLRTL